VGVACQQLCHNKKSLARIAAAAEPNRWALGLIEGSVACIVRRSVRRMMMSLSFPDYLLCLSIGLVVLILSCVVRIVFRKKFMEAFLKIRETNRERFIQSRERFLNSERRMLGLFRLGLWLVVLMAVLLPLITYLYIPTFFLASVLYMLLFLIGFLLEYFFRKWLLQRLQIEIGTPD
jgi:hypothetical protein